MTTPFIFFEFDSSLFQKYYGSGINTPGIYAIPEDGVEPSSDPDEFNPNPAAGNEEDDTGLDQRDDNRDNILQTVQSLPDIQPPQMSQEEQQAFEQEIQPLKKVYLLNKLGKLRKVLQDSSLSNDNLLIVLKYGPYLTYNTLKLLTIQIVNDLKKSVPEQFQKSEDGPENNQSQTPPSNVIDNNNTNGDIIGATDNVS